MKIQIRQGNFETNSSSSHTLVIGSGKLIKPEILEEQLVLIGGEYNQGKVLNHWRDKANYLAEASYFVDSNRSPKNKRFKKKLEKILSEYLGVKVIIIAEKDKPYGYINYNTKEKITAILREWEEEDILNFIFRYRSKAYIDWDSLELEYNLTDIFPISEFKYEVQCLLNGKIIAKELAVTDDINDIIYDGIYYPFYVNFFDLVEKYLEDMYGDGWLSIEKSIFYVQSGEDIPVKFSVVEKKI